MNDHDPILSKVRKLLALAEDPAATDARGGDVHRQGDPADRRLRHRPGAARPADPATDPVGNRVITLDAPYAADKVDLLATVAHPALRHRTAHPPHPPARRSCRCTCSVTPATSSASRSCSPACCCSRRTPSPRTPVPACEHKAAFRRSWLAGFRMAVGGRLAAAESRAEASAADRFRAGTSTALVLADRTAGWSPRWRRLPGLGTARPRTLSGSGSGQGWAAGQRADLGGTALDGGRRRLTGRR